MIDRLLDWIEDHFLASLYAVLLALVLLLVGVFASLAHAATIEGSFTLPTSYIDGTPLPIGNIKHIRVQVGTCSASNQVLTKEGEQLVPPPATTFSVTVPRAFGKFCAQTQTETTLGTLSDWTNPVYKVVPEPKPNPPIMLSTGGWAYDVKNSSERVVGVIPAGKPCGSSAVVGELFPVERSDVQLLKPQRPGSVLAARCAPASS